MSKEYKKQFAPYYSCPICGKLTCKLYGSSKVMKKILQRKYRRTINNKIKELKGESND